jgi:hypothetical protein
MMQIEDVARAVADLRNMVVSRFSALWPVGSVFLSVVATNPATLLGFGTWTQIAGGKFLVGQTGGDAAFDAAEETGGSKTKNLAHAHGKGSLAADNGGVDHNHGVNPPNTNSSGPVGVPAMAAAGMDITVPASDHCHGTDIGEFASGGASAYLHPHTISGDTAGAGSATQDILPPYLVVYIFKRTA